MNDKQEAKFQELTGQPVGHLVCKMAAPTLSLIHISEPTRLGMISYAVFCLKKKKKKTKKKANDYGV